MHRAAFFIACGRLRGDVVPARYPPEELDFVGKVGPTVGVEDVVEPAAGPARDLFVFVAIPGEMGLGSTRDEPPAESGHTVLLRLGQDRLEGAALRAGHIFGAQDRPAEAL